LSQLFRADGNSLIPLVATGLIAVLFQPVRAQFQRGINRLMYGERDDPAAVAAALGRRLDVPLAPGAALRAIAETVASALKLPAVAITLRRGDAAIVARYPPGGTDAADPAAMHATHTFPLTYGGGTVGELRLARRPGESDFGPADRRLLADLARQAGVAVHAIRLSADLQAARERLVLAREEERRRLRRDLHDGLGPRLAALTLRLDTARDTLADDPRADALLGDLAARMAEAVADIRRLVYALRPPALDDLGLVGALRGAAESYGPAAPSIAVEAPDWLPPLSAAVEVAAYRIALEALTNAVRHAHASRCTIRLSVDAASEALSVAIEDDGVGIAPARIAGIGCASMRERAEELGGTCAIELLSTGGTRVFALLPRRAADGAREGG
jgi:signal transduction histidine kinase